MTNILKTFLTKEVLFLVVIFLVAFFIRTYQLSSRPIGFHMDEISNTYVGRFILLNGKDLYGNTWPLFYFDKFGDFPPVIPMYLSGAASFMFGLNEFSARFPAALFGSLLIVPLYIFLKTCVSSRFAIIASLVITIMPWHVILSRSSSEGIIALTVFVSGLAILFLGIVHKKVLYVFFSWIFLCLSYFLYPSFRIITPLILFPLPLMYREDKRILSQLFFSIGLFSLLTILIFLTPWGKGRFSQVSLLQNQTDAAIIRNDLLQLSNDEKSLFAARVFNNKVVGYGQRFVNQYISYFSPEFLYARSALPPRYAVPHIGLIYLTFLIFIISFFLTRRNFFSKNVFIYSLYLLCIAPLPSAITVDDFPNMHRSVFMIIPLTIFISAGILNIYLFANVKKIMRFFVIIILGTFLLELIFFNHQYFSHAGSINPFYRTDGNKQMALYLKDINSKYPSFTASYANWFIIYYLFYTNNFDKNLIGTFKSDFRMKSYKNIHFIEDECPSSVVYKKALQKQSIPFKNTILIDSGNCENNAKFKLLRTISRYDETTAFRVLQIDYSDPLFRY